MDVELTKLSGDVLRFSDYDINVLDFKVSSIPVSGLYGQIEGRAGAINYGADFGSRTIEISFYLNGKDNFDFPLLRDVLFEITTTKEPVYLREMRASKYSHGNKYVGGKRYLARIQGEYKIDQVVRYGFGTIIYETVELPYAESIGTSLDIHNNGISSEDELWSYGMGIIEDEDSRKYIHSTNEFKIYNAGNVEVHPFEQDLRIEITEVSGSGFTLTNETTGETFIYEGNLSAMDELVIDGPNVTVNGVPALRNTNKRFISFAPGWNSLTKNKKGVVSVNMRFYYK